MLLGRVTGTVVASRKEPLIEGWKLLVVRQLDAAGAESQRVRRRGRRGRRRRGRGRPLRHGQLGPPDRDDEGPALRRRDHGDRRHLGGRRDRGLPQVADGSDERARRARDPGDHRTGPPARGGGRRRAARRGPARGGGAVGRGDGRARRRHPRHDRRRGGGGRPRVRGLWRPRPGRPQGRSSRPFGVRCSTMPSSSRASLTRRPGSVGSTTRSSRTASSRRRRRVPRTSRSRRSPATPG